MKNFILSPNLPQRKVTELICGANDEPIADFFTKNGISVLKNEPNDYIDPSVSTHADMAAIHLGGNKIIVDKGQKGLKAVLEEHGFEASETAEKITGGYPGDVKLNFALIGNNAVGNFAYCDKVLFKLLANKNNITVKQGYCKCSVLTVDEGSAITDDSSVYKALIKNGLDVLLISKGDISLDGHGYGFIGGASGKISKDTVLFFGDVKKHRDFRKIADFLAAHSCTYLCSDGGALRDIGGILPLIEE
ncbi:MAG: hypothetical protein E7538_02580 [Ruminococcaceae bacterium]|nr:hypothetical protein [Oscillospiraceae bacterium]